MAGATRAVRCVETGEIYASMSDAARALGLFGPQALYQAIRSGCKAGGHHWEYASERTLAKGTSARTL
eukprot:g79502.t1